MLCRLPENHKANAVWLLFGDIKYNPLQELPHDDFLVWKVCFKTCILFWSEHTDMLYYTSILSGRKANLANNIWD